MGRLRSADVNTCSVPRTNTQLGDRSLAVAGPRFWNTLPAKLFQLDTKTGYISAAAKNPFVSAWSRRIVTSVLIVPYKYSSTTTAVLMTNYCLLKFSLEPLVQ